MLSRKALVLTVCAAWATCAVVADEKPKVDLAGTWQLTSYFRGPNNVDKEKIETTVTFEGEAYKTDGRNFPGKTGKFKIDASKKPNEITLIPNDGPAKGKELPGIIEVDGNKLKICVTQAGANRPVKFEAGDNTTMLLEAERQKK